MCIRCSGNLITELLPSNNKGICRQQGDLTSLLRNFEKQERAYEIAVIAVYPHPLLDNGTDTSSNSVKQFPRQSIHKQQQKNSS
jgi:hypothetical protein